MKGDKNAPRQIDNNNAYGMWIGKKCMSMQKKSETQG